MKTISRLSFSLLKVLTVLLIVTGFITLLDQLWPYAINQTRQQLAEDPDFERRLSRYANLSSTAERVLSITAPGAVTVDIFIGGMKQAGAWDDLVRLLNASTPGAGVALEILDDVIHKVAALQRNLNHLQDMRGLAGASRAFRYNPQRAELEALAGYCGGPGAGALTEISYDIDTLAQALGSLDSGMVELLTGLEAARNGSVLGRLFAPEITKIVLAIRPPLMQLHEDVELLSRDVRGDIRNLEMIHLRVSAVSTIDNILNSLPVLPQIRARARYIWERLDLALYLALVLIVTGYAYRFGDWYYEQRARRIRRIAPLVVAVHTGASPPSNVAQQPTRDSHPTTKPSRVISETVSPPTIKGWLLQRATQGGSSRTIALPPRGKITLGSAGGNEVKLRSSSVSAYHAAVTAARACYFIQDLHSVSGTLVNGNAIAGARRLQHGDTITLGDVELVFLSGNAIDA
jgi:hypothetical protein